MKIRLLRGTHRVGAPKAGAVARPVIEGDPLPVAARADGFAAHAGQACEIWDERRRLLLGCGPELTRLSAERAGALAHFDLAIAERPDDGQLLMLKASVLTDLSRPHEAAAVFRDILSLDPANQKARTLLAGVEWFLGRRAEALELLTRVADDSPDDLSLRMRVAKKHLQVESLAGAAEGVVELFGEKRLTISTVRLSRQTEIIGYRLEIHIPC